MTPTEQTDKLCGSFSNLATAGNAALMRHLILRIVRSHDAEATPHFPDYRSNRKVQKLWKPRGLQRASEGPICSLISPHHRHQGSLPLSLGPGRENCPLFRPTFDAAVGRRCRKGLGGGEFVRPCNLEHICHLYHRHVGAWGKGRNRNVGQRGLTLEYVIPSPIRLRTS